MRGPPADAGGAERYGRVCVRSRRCGNARAGCASSPAARLADAARARYIGRQIAAALGGFLFGCRAAVGQILVEVPNLL